MLLVASNGGKQPTRRELLTKIQENLLLVLWSKEIKV